VTQAAREVVVLVEAAAEPRRVRVAARTAHAVAPDAKHFTGAPVAARAGHGIEACRLSVCIRRAWGTGPAGWVGVPADRIGARDSRSGMTVDTEELAVTDDAHARLSRGFLVVNREEVGAMHRLAHRRVERQT